jgi:hypothetical protein
MVYLKEQPAQTERYACLAVGRSHRFFFFHELMQIFTAVLPRQLVRASNPAVFLRSISCSARALQPASDKAASRLFLSSPFSETDDSERRYIQARTTVITPSQQAGKGDDFQAEHMHDKLKKVELCKRYNLQPRDVRGRPGSTATRLHVTMT